MANKNLNVKMFVTNAIFNPLFVGVEESAMLLSAFFQITHILFLRFSSCFWLFHMILGKFKNPVMEAVLLH